VEDWRVYTLVIGVVAALIGIYFRESLRQAHVQKNAANRLLAYLNYWNQNILDWDVFSIVYVGHQWREEKIEAYRKSGDMADVLAVNEEYENKLKEIRDGIKNEDEKFDFDSVEIAQKLKKITPEFMEEFLIAQRANKQNIIEGKSFITDEDAASLGPSVAEKCISAKLRLVSLLEHGTILLILLSNEKGQIRISKFSEEIYQCIRISIIMYQDFEPLRKSANAISGKSIFRLSLSNMASGL
jgi:hypothetical protein